MTIKNIGSGNVNFYQTRVELEQQRQVQRAETGVQPQEVAKGDRVSVSSEAKLRTEAYQAAMNAPDIRQDKVDAIKNQIASGEYAIDSRKTAEKLLGSERLLAETITD